MKYKELRNIIVKSLNDYLKLDVVPSDDSDKRPKYPYITYKFTTKHKSQGSYNLVQNTIPSRDTRFEKDIEYTRREQPKVIISFTAYSLDDAEATDLAENIKSWFNFEGRQYLIDNNIVTVETTDIQDRTIHIVDEYEQRQGFDVTIRYSTERKMIVETIESINVNKEVD